MLSQALDIHSAVGKPRDRDWVYLLLDFLKAYIQDLGKQLLLTEPDHVTYVTNLVHALSDAARDAPSGMYLALLPRNIPISFFRRNDSP